MWINKIILKVKKKIGKLIQAASDKLSVDYQVIKPILQKNWQLTRFLLHFYHASLCNIFEIRIMSCRRIRGLLRLRSRWPRRFFRLFRLLRPPWSGKIFGSFPSRSHDLPISHISGFHIRHKWPGDAQKSK